MTVPGSGANVLNEPPANGCSMDHRFAEDLKDEDGTTPERIGYHIRWCPTCEASWWVDRDH